MSPDRPDCRATSGVSRRRFRGVTQPRTAAPPETPPIRELRHTHFIVRPRPAPLVGGLDQSEQLGLGLERHILSYARLNACRIAVVTSRCSQPRMQRTAS